MVRFQVIIPDVTFTNFVVVSFLAVGNIRVHAGAITYPTTHKFHARKRFKGFANVATR